MHCLKWKKPWAMYFFGIFSTKFVIAIKITKFICEY